MKLNELLKLVRSNEIVVKLGKTVINQKHLCNYTNYEVSFMELQDFRSSDLLVYIEQPTEKVYTATERLDDIEKIIAGILDSEEPYNHVLFELIYIHKLIGSPELVVKNELAFWEVKK